jgi:NAD(P)-dependent dehydrogenase (short-subunit alcohol dehydrogenase family)
MRLKDRVAIITGAASGMGQATALRFLDEGACVVVADFNEQNGQATLKLAGDAGHSNNVRFIRTDVAKEADVKAMIDCAVSSFGRLDIVFNNAGIGGAIGPSGISRKTSGIIRLPCCSRACSSGLSTPPG